MRAIVGHLDRRIRIIGQSTDNLGAHVQVYHYILGAEGEENYINARGSAYLNGVEFVNCAQPNSENAGVQILLSDSEGE